MIRMKKYFLLFLVFTLAADIASANNGDYAVNKIPSTLLKDAWVVKRMDESTYQIISFTKARLYEKFAITILNENGDPFASLYRTYDKLRSIESIEGKLFDANGKEIRSLKKKDIEDLSGVSEESLMQDNRIKKHNFYYKVYPYTVEYEVVTEFNNTYLFPDWFPQPAEHYAVEKSEMIVVCPESFKFHYKSFNFKGEPLINNTKDGKTYEWDVINLPAIIKEYDSPEWPYLTTCVYFSPDQFAIEGYNGDLSSWKNFGNFIYQLNAGRDKLPDVIKQKVHEITDNIKDEKEKVKILYEYMQKNTRYISVQLGIGGLQPFDASYVASKSYGDCKALTNYMYSLLKEINTKSDYTLIKSGAGEFFFLPDFPSDQFDHIILCVPLKTDTMWLECTSQTLPAGYLSDFTCDRYALATDENGGKLIHTPKYGLNENFQIRKVTATLDDEATLTINESASYKGLQEDLYHDLMNSLSRDKIKDFLHDQLDLGTYEVNNFDYKEEKSSLPVINEMLNITVSNYATITGKRLFITPDIMNRSGRKFSFDEERKYEIVLKTEYKDIDSVEIQIPKGYEQESIPEPVNIESKFGKYSSEMKLNGNKIIFYRSMEQYSGRFPAKDYIDLAKFYNAIYKADRSKAVLVKNETNSFL